MEKRRHKRLAIDVPVTIRSQGKLIPATAVNVSCGGMYLKTETKDIAENSSIEVTFDLDSENKDISLSGTVARVDSILGFGVQFGNYFSASHKALREFLRKQMN